MWEVTHFMLEKETILYKSRHPFRRLYVTSRHVIQVCSIYFLPLFAIEGRGSLCLKKQTKIDANDKKYN